MEKDVALVIGVGGMGRAIGRRIGNGRTLVLADFDQHLLAGCAQALTDEGYDIRTHVVDVGDRASMVDLAAVTAAYGRVIAIAHTAGVSGAKSSADAILRVDLLGVALMLELFGEVIAPGGAGIVIASQAGHFASLPAEQEVALAHTASHDLLDLPFLAPDVLSNPHEAYVIAKRGNHLRVQGAAAAWGMRGARINSISPGMITTPQLKDELDSEAGEIMRLMLASSAAGRFGTPEDVTSAAAFLLDHAQASLLTGTDLLLDGGVYAAFKFQPASGDAPEPGPDART